MFQDYKIWGNLKQLAPPFLQSCKGHCREGANLCVCVCVCVSVCVCVQVSVTVFWVTRHENDMQVCGQDSLHLFLPAGARLRSTFSHLPGDRQLSYSELPSSTSLILSGKHHPADQHLSFPNLSSSMTSHSLLLLQFSLQTSLFWNITLTLPSLLPFYTTFLINLLIFTCCGFDRNCIKSLQIKLGRIDILTILSLPSHEH